MGQALLVAAHLLSPLMVELFTWRSRPQSITLRWHGTSWPLRAKDMGSAAQFISLTNIAALWALVLLWR